MAFFLLVIFRLLLSWIIVLKILMLRSVCLFAFSGVEWQTITCCKSSRLLIVLRKCYIALVKIKFWSLRFRVRGVLLDWHCLCCGNNFLVLTCFIGQILFNTLLWWHGVWNASWWVCLFALLKLYIIAYSWGDISHLGSSALICLSKNKHILILLIFTLWVANVRV